MILLDTNVASELMRETPERAVAAWVASQLAKDLFFSAVGEAELRHGAAILPAGRRREQLLSRIEGVLREAFGDRVLAFDRNAARAFGEIAAMRRAAGRHVEPLDCQIAAIARSRGLAVATRNTGDFEDTGVDLVDPWVVA